MLQFVEIFHIKRKAENLIAIRIQKGLWGSNSLPKFRRENEEFSEDSFGIYDDVNEVQRFRSSEGILEISNKFNS